MQVQKNKTRTPEEEYAYIWDKLSMLGNFVPWEVHPNVIKANDITKQKLWTRLKKLVDSEEYKHYTSVYGL